MKEYSQTSVFERLEVRTIRFSSRKFEMKMAQYSNKNSVLEQLEQKKKKQQRHVTAKMKRKLFPVDHRTRYSTFIVTLCFIVTFIIFIVIKITCYVFRFIYTFVFYLLFK